jgi:hypothetical protein
MQKWYDESNYIVVLSVGDLQELTALLHNLSLLGAPVCATYEPDLDTVLTCIAAGPARAVRRMLVGVPLAMKEDAPALC